jgi:hypothetical protein
LEKREEREGAEENKMRCDTVDTNKTAKHDNIHITHEILLEIDVNCIVAGLFITQAATPPTIVYDDTISYQLRKLGKIALSYLDTFIH